MNKHRKFSQKTGVEKLLCNNIQNILQKSIITLHEINCPKKKRINATKNETVVEKFVCYYHETFSNEEHYSIVN